MVSHHPVKFGGCKHCGSGVVDMFLVAEQQDLTCSHLDPPLLFFYRRHGGKEHGIKC